jgi:hypothetical protein
MAREVTAARESGLTAARLGGLLLIALQFAAATQLLRLLAFESRTLYEVMVLALVGFPINALLPRERRLPFFALLSLASVGLVFGLGGGAVLVGLGAVLIAACHVPVAFRYRVALVVAVIAGFTALRATLPGGPIPPQVWPILGSMFMLRVALYLNSIKRGDAPVGLVPALAYFFMVPNACFAWFPVVDYKTFQRSHFDCEEQDIFQRGMRRIARGLFLLAIYRVVYHQLVLDPSAVQSLASLAQYITALFALYVRVAGQFYLIVGILHLFGFRLPDPFYRFVLPSSFTDLWRRNNIYLKDYLMKLVYYPSFFRLRPGGETRAIVISTVFVFVVSWALHSFAWFWVLGAPLLTATDITFWLLLGTLVGATAIWDLRQAARPRRSGWWDLRLAGGRLMTLTVLVTMWAMWSGGSLGEFADLLALGRNAPAREIALVGVAVLAAFAVLGIRWGATVVTLEPPSRSQRREDLIVSLAALAILFVASLPAVHRQAGLRAGAVLASVADARLNIRDAQLLNQNYYDRLNTGNRGTTQLWGQHTNQPEDWIPLRDTEAGFARQDFLLDDMRPSVSITYRDHPFTTNRWGMRDQDYSKEKPAGTYRIAMVGPSDVMGSGVGDGEPFEALLEERLNRELGGRRYQRYEILNFSAEGRTPAQFLFTIDEKVKDFAPDLVLVTAHREDGFFFARHVGRLLEAGQEIPYPEVRDVVKRAGVKPGMGFQGLRRRLEPLYPEITEWVYPQIRDRVAAMGAITGVLLLREPTAVPDSLTVVRRVVAQAGLPVVDLTRAYPPRQEPVLRIAQWDRHPNAQGHQALAKALYRALAEQDSVFGIGFDQLR